MDDYYLATQKGALIQAVFNPCHFHPKVAKYPTMNRIFGIVILLTALTVPCWAQQNFTGDGGRGKSIAILAPEATGLAENQSYLPILVQGEFVSNFSGYSAISVLDRVNSDKVYAELLSGFYSDNDAAGLDLGHWTATDYLLNGDIIRTAAGYALQIKITKTSDKTTAASYSGTFSFMELDDLTGIRRASLDLLPKMGVTLTERARQELAGGAVENHVQAQTALAQGINAQKQGTEVAALSYYYQAAALDPSLAEAANRSSIVIANISNSNIGDNVRNDIQWRREWVARLTETERYFDNFYKNESMPYTLFYSDEIKQGTINYQNETVNLSIETNLRNSQIWAASVERALQAVYNGLNATGRKDTWGLANWPRQGVTNLNAFASTRRNGNFSVVFELVNNQNKVIGRQTLQAGGYWEWNNGTSITVSTDGRKTLNFQNVNANDISDRMTIRVATVNGTNAETAARNGVLQIKALTATEFNVNSILKFTRGELQGFTYTNTRVANLVIPGTIWGVPVTSIGAGAFMENRLTGVTIPNSVTSIGESAFEKNGLTSVTIPDSVTSIGGKAFRENQLTSITVGNGVTTIGESAFYRNRLTSVTIGSSVTGIGADAFRENQLTSVTIPNSVTIIGNQAFRENRLTSVTIGNGVTRIGNEAFRGNQLTSVTIPNSVTTIGDWAFGRNRLTSVTIGNRVTSIGRSAFGENQLTSITIPDSVTNIENEAFQQNRLASVIIGKGVTRIGSGAFRENQLTSVTIGANVRIDFSAIGSEFERTYSNNGRPAGTYRRESTRSEIWGMTNGDFSYFGSTIVRYNGSGGAVTIPPAINGTPITSIGPGAFSEKRLTSVTIPNSVRTIGESAFRGNQLTNVTIPDSVTGIGDWAFGGNRLTGVTIGNRVTSIGNSAFRDNQLSSVTIPNSVTIIKGGAFFSNRLSSVTIGANVTLEGNAFDNNNSIEDDYNQNGKKAGVYSGSGKYKAR